MINTCLNGQENTGLFRATWTFCEVGTLAFMKLCWDTAACIHVSTAATTLWQLSGRSRDCCQQSPRYVIWALLGVFWPWPHQLTIANISVFSSRVFVLWGWIHVNTHTFPVTASLSCTLCCLFPEKDLWSYLILLKMHSIWLTGCSILFPWFTFSQRFLIFYDYTVL